MASVRSVACVFVRDKFKPKNLLIGAYVVALSIAFYFVLPERVSKAAALSVLAVIFASLSISSRANDALFVMAPSDPHERERLDWWMVLFAAPIVGLVAGLMTFVGSLYFAKVPQDMAREAGVWVAVPLASLGLLLALVRKGKDVQPAPAKVEFSKMFGGGNNHALLSLKALRTYRAIWRGISMAVGVGSVFYAVTRYVSDAL